MGSTSKSTLHLQTIATLVGVILIGIQAIFGQSPKKVFKTGMEFYESQNYEDAIQQFTEAIELKTDFTEAYVQRAESYLNLNRLEEAVQDFRRAIAFDTKNDELYFKAGKIYAEIGSDSLAREMLSSTLELDKKYFEAYPLLMEVLWNLGDSENALIVAQMWVELKKYERSYYFCGLAFDSLENLPRAVVNYDLALKENEKFVAAYISKSRALLALNELKKALFGVDKALNLDGNNIDALVLKSQIEAASQDFPNAINNISRAIVLDPDNKDWYVARGHYNMHFSQYAVAIGDFNKVISLEPEYALGYYYRAQANAETGNINQAIKDYEKFQAMSPDQPGLEDKIQDAKRQLYDLNREEVNPEILISMPKINNETQMQIPKKADTLWVKGVVTDQSLIHNIEINGVKAIFDETTLNPEFELGIPLDTSQTSVSIVVTDIYFNVLLQNYAVLRTEVDPPLISLRAPVSSDSYEIFLDVESPTLYIEGQVDDESKIKQIRINDMLASFPMNDINPVFSATVSIANINSIKIYCEDVFGNSKVTEFTLNRDAIGLLADNPMGKTWVVFIENSNYTEFASLDGPEKDISTMRASLANYKISNVIHKKDLTKEKMERFFSIELRDLIRANQVNSLLIWYAGHGKFINETGYWIPTDASRDDEFTYFNINVIKSSLQSYYAGLTHTLVVNDACESGASFADLTRGENEDRRCSNWEDVRSKSSQVFTSAGYELAIDNSQFTKTFASTLKNNDDSCIPIEEIVKRVKVSVKQNNKQTPKFGIISGLGDENGTFFFIKK
jgi:tetratricopeptide (TPR) repeat protein